MSSDIASRTNLLLPITASTWTRSVFWSAARIAALYGQLTLEPRGNKCAGEAGSRKLFVVQSSDCSVARPKDTPSPIPSAPAETFLEPAITPQSGGSRTHSKDAARPGAGSAEFDGPQTPSDLTRHPLPPRQRLGAATSSSPLTAISNPPRPSSAEPAISIHPPPRSNNHLPRTKPTPTSVVKRKTHPSPQVFPLLSSSLLSFQTTLKIVSSTRSTFPTSSCVLYPCTAILIRPA